MRKVVLSVTKRGMGRPTSFTLIELLVVMAIIIILASMTLWAAQSLWTRAARSRAMAEITAMSAGLEGYKTDNGIYPQASNVLGGTAASYPIDPTSASYKLTSQVLYENLSGKTNFNDITLATRSYMTFKVTQLGNYTAAAGSGYAATTSTYVQDPWSYSYGYSTGDGTTNNTPANGSGFFDLWSTTGLTTTTVGNSTTTYATNAWVSNWRSQ